jgi:hypothetical protein
MTAAMAMHADRTAWTPAAATVELVVAVARGALDAWSGRFLRAGTDTVEGLAARAREPLGDGRRLLVRPHGPGDPLA